MSSRRVTSGGGVASVGVALASSWSLLLCPTASFAQVPLGPEFRVNQATAGEQENAAVGFARDGSFMVSWRSDFWNRGGQRFDRDGNRIGDELFLEDWGGHSSVAFDDDGSFVVAWGGFYGLVAGRFDVTGGMLGEAVGWFSFGGAFLNDVAVAPSGEFVVAWVEYGTRIFARRYDAENNAVSTYLPVRELPAAAETAPAVAMAANHEFAVVWAESEAGSSRVLGRRYGQSTEPLGPAFVVSTDTVAPKTEVDVAMTPDGAFVAVWRSDGQDGDGPGIFAQRYDAAGRRLGSERRVNRDAAGRQADPAVAMRADGNFVVTWTSLGQDGSEEGVFAQQFDASGARVGGELQVNARTDGPQTHPAVAMSRRGSVVAVWDGPPRVGAPQDIFGRQIGAPTLDFDNDGVPNSADNCPTRSNPDQADAQGDGFGDSCVSPDVVIPASARLGFAPIIGSGTRIEDGVTVGDDASIGELVTLQRQVSAGDRLVVGDLVSIGPRSKLGDDVSVGAGVRIEGGVVIGDTIAIGDHALIRRNTVIGDGASIGPLVVLFAGVLIGEGATVEMGARVGRGAIVRPGAVVPAGTTVPPGATVSTLTR